MESKIFLSGPPMCNAWCFLDQCKEYMGHQKYTTDGANWPGSRRDGDPFLAKRTAGVPGRVQSREEGVAGADSVLGHLLTRRSECSSSSVFMREKRWPLPEASYDNNDWLSTDLQAAENLAGSTLILWWSYDWNLAAPTLWCHREGKERRIFDCMDIGQRPRAKMQQDAAMESDKWQHCRPPCCAQLLSVTAECGRWLTGEEALEDTTREDGDVCW